MIVRSVFKLYLPVAAFVLLAGGCTGDADKPAAASPAPTVEALIKDSAGKDIGKALFVQTDGGIEVTVSATGLPAGPHGTHVHMTGKCDAPDFTTAGGHWNPAGKQHGLENLAGAHEGDLPNMDVLPDGSGVLKFVIAGGTLSGTDHSLLDSDGAALVIHADADDMKTDPAGNAGKRLACGVIEPTA